MNRIKDLLLSDPPVATLLGLFTFLLYYPFIFIGVDFLHHGVLVATTYALNHGSVLFRDIFYQYGALSAFIHLLSFKLFGENLYSIQFITLLFYPVISFVFYHLSRQFLSKLESLTITLVWILSAYFFYWSTQPGSHTYSLAFSLISAVFIINALKRNPKFMILGGIFAFLAFLSRQSVGLFYCLSVLLFLILFLIKVKSKDKKFFQRLIFFYLIGLFLPFFIFFFYFWNQSALYDWWQNTIGFSIVWGKQRGYGYDLIYLLRAIYPVDIRIVIRKIIFIFSLCSLILVGKRLENPRIRIVLWLISSILILITVSNSLKLSYLIFNVGDPVIPLVLAISNSFGILILFRNILSPNSRIFNIKNATFTFLIFISVASWTQYYPLNDPVHTYYSLPFMLLLGANILKKILPQNNFRLFFLVIFLLFIPGGFPRLWRGLNKLDSLKSMKRISQPPVLSGEFEKKEIAVEIEKFYSDLKRIRNTYPGIQVRIIGEEPMVLAFLPDNIIPKIFFDYGEHYEQIFPGYRQKLLDSIKKDQAIAVVNGIDYDSAPKFAELLNYKILRIYPAIRQIVLIPYNTAYL